MIGTIPGISPLESPAQVRQDAIDVADHYGIVPAFMVGNTPIAAEQASGDNPDIVTAVTPAVRITPAHDGIGSIIDYYA